MAVRPPEHLQKHPEHTVHAAALHATMPLKIELKDVARVTFTGTVKDKPGDTHRETIPAISLSSASAECDKILIEEVVLLDGDTLNLARRKTSYIPWADIITVTGSEIVFDKLDGRYDPEREIIYGYNIEGDSVTLRLEDIAYVRTVIMDYAASLTFFAGFIIASVLMAM